jgi:hypothetical protein
MREKQLSNLLQALENATQNHVHSTSYASHITNFKIEKHSLENFLIGGASRLQDIKHACVSTIGNDIAL